MSVWTIVDKLGLKVFEKEPSVTRVLTINFETNRDHSSFETLPLLIFINSSDNDLDEIIPAHAKC